MAEYSPWVDEIYEGSLEEREKALNHVVQKFAKHSEKANALAAAVANLEEFEKPSFMTHVHLVRMNSGEAGKIEHMKFEKPAFAVKHKKLPVVFIMGESEETFRGPRSLHEKSEIDQTFDIPQVLSWPEVVSRASKGEKEKLKDMIVEGIRDHRSKSNPKEKKNFAPSRKETRWLSDLVSDGREFEVVGFAANAPYINIDKDYGDTQPIWVHPWGVPTLLLKLKGNPAMMMVGPAIRLNENFLGDRSMEGYTG